MTAPVAIVGGGLERFARGPRKAVLVPAFGQVRNLSQWAKRSPVDCVVLLKRLVAGWHPESAIATRPLTKNGATWVPLESATVDAIREAYTRGLTIVEVAAELGLTVKVTETAMKKAGIGRRVAAKRDQRRERNHSWIGGRIVDGNGYVCILKPEHPRANVRGYVKEHILVMERRIGRPLVWHGPEDPRSEIVHHKDFNKQNNDPGNLEIHSYASHLALHRGYEARSA